MFSVFCNIVFRILDGIEINGNIGTEWVKRVKGALREKCPNTEFFLVPIFLFYGVNLCVFSPNTGKYGPQKTPFLDTFHALVVKVGN